MIVIGISGQTGAGKSTLADQLNKLKNWRNLEVDALGHELLKQPSTISSLVKAFGNDILTKSEIDRKKLGAKAFVSSEATEKLNSIMHPSMVEMVKKIIEDEKANGSTGIIINAALLYKMKLNVLCDRIIYVKADAEVRLARLMENRGWTEQRARERLFSQDQEPNNDSKAIIVENNSDTDTFFKQIEKISEELCRL